MSSLSELSCGPVSTDTAGDEFDSGESTEKNGAEEETSQTTARAKDHDIVDWDGPADLANPQNWKPGAKLTHVLLVSGFTLYS